MRLIILISVSCLTLPYIFDITS